MTESVSTEKGGMQRTHIVVFSTPGLRELLLQAKEPVPKSGLGVGQCIDFLPRNGHKR
jgi:hypothetical protein